MAPAPAPRNYWQLPVFALGLAAAAAAYAHFPPPPTDPRAALQRDLADLRPKLERAPLDPGLDAATRRIAERLRALPDAPAAAHFLVASAFVKLAEIGPAAEAANFWVAAKQQLDAIPDGALPDAEDARRLAYRRAKVTAALGGGDPAELFKILNAPPFREDAQGGGERARLLAELLLRKPRPGIDDWKRARDELTVYLSAPSRLPAAALARLRLQLAQVHVALNEPDKARTWLREVGATAPPETQSAAKALLGRLAAQDHNWGDAVRLYESALALPGLPPAEQAAVRYHTGAALVRLKAPAEAANYFEQAMKEDGPVAAAARIRRAELLLDDPLAKGARGPAVAWLEEAVRGVPSPGDFANPFVSLPEIQAAFEEATQVTIAEGDFASALKGATAYGAVSAPGRGQERRAEIHVAWAATAPRTPEAAARLRSAAADYAALVDGHPQSTGRADLWRRAADCLRKAGDLPAALVAVRKVTGAAGLPADVRAAAWLDQGDLLLAGRDFAPAEAAFQEAVRLGGPPAAMAQVRLAMVSVTQARQQLAALPPEQQGEARTRLEYGAELLGQVANRAADTPPEREAQQRALFELGKLLLAQGALADAEARFRQLLQLNPAGPLAPEARLYLGSCLMIIAGGDQPPGGPPADAPRKLQEARELFEQLAASSDPYLRMHADVRVVNVALLLEQHDALPALCEKAAARYKGRVEELIVWGVLYKSQTKTDRRSDAARTLDAMRAVYAALPAELFDGAAEQYTRDYWEAEYFAPVRAAEGR